MTLIIFIIILALLILSHELGHFWVAKAGGVKVEEFGFGFPPRLFSFRRGETIYSINLLPFGGFVKIFGENPAEEKTEEPISLTEKPRSLAHKPKWLQAAVLLAGVTFNFILAWLLLSIGFATTGLPVSTRNLPSDYQPEQSKVIIVGLLADQPAVQAGLQTGDEITAVSVGAQRIVQPSIEEIQAIVAEASSKKVIIEYARNKSSEIVSLQPQKNAAGQSAIGVELDEIGTLRLDWWPALIEGGRSAGVTFVMTIRGFGELFSRWWHGENAFAVVTGPVGIVGLVGEASARGLAALITLTAIISVNLAVLNLVPFPALDGGRLLILAIETIIRKRIKPSVVNAVNFVGFSILIILMLIITYGDLVKLF